MVIRPWGMAMWDAFKDDMDKVRYSCGVCCVVLCLLLCDTLCCFVVRCGVMWYGDGWCYGARLMRWRGV